MPAKGDAQCPLTRRQLALLEHAGATCCVHARKARKFVQCSNELYNKIITVISQVGALCVHDGRGQRPSSQLVSSAVHHTLRLCTKVYLGSV